MVLKYTRRQVLVESFRRGCHGICGGFMILLVRVAAAFVPHIITEGASR